MFRRISLASAVAACGLLALSPDTGAPAGAAAVADAPGAAGATPAGDAPGATPGATPGDNVTPAAPAAGATRPRRGKGAAGMSVFAVDSFDAGKALAKEKGERFTVFTVKSPAAIAKPDRFYVSNHRNAVQHKVATDDGYHFQSGTGERIGRPVSPEAKRETADKLLAEMDESTRQALFAKYLQGNPALAAALPPAAGPRNDTSPDFAATLNGGNGNGAAAAPPATSAPAAAPAAKPGNAGKSAPAAGGRSRK